MPIELKITMKNEHKTLTRDWLLYEEVTISESDETIAQCLSECHKEFNAEPESVKVKTLMVLR
jgi:hypothetical protein